VRTLGLLLCLLAAPQALAGVPLCCVLPGSSCCNSTPDEPVPDRCPNCPADDDAQPEQEKSPTDCDCPARHTRWATAPAHDTDADHASVLATVPAPIVAVVLLAAPATNTDCRQTPHPLPAALSLPLLL